MPVSDSGDIAILGAGICGLSLAYYLSKAGCKVTVFEQEAQAGGFLDSVNINGAGVEKYYHHLLTGFSSALELAQEIGLADSIIWKQARMGFQYDERLYPFNGALDLFNFKPLSFFGRAQLGAGLFALSLDKDWRKLDKLSAGELLQKRTGRQSWEKIWKPLLKMKFGSAYEDVSAAWVWDRVKTRRGSQKIGKSRECLGYIRGGFKRLTGRLSEIVVSKGGELLLSSRVSGVSPDGKGAVDIRFSQDKRRSFKYVFSTIPLPSLLEAGVFFSGQVSEAMLKVKYQHVLCALLRLKRSVSNYYWVNLVAEEMPFVVMVEHTNLVEPKEYGGEHIVYLVKYCSADDDFFLKDDAFIKDKARAALRKLSPGIEASDIIKEEIFRGRHAQPVFCKGFAEIKNTLAGCRELTLLDSTQAYPYSRSTNSAVFMAKSAAQEFLKNA